MSLFDGIERTFERVLGKIDEVSPSERAKALAELEAPVDHSRFRAKGAEEDKAATTPSSRVSSSSPHAIRERLAPVERPEADPNFDSTTARFSTLEIPE